MNKHFSILLHSVLLIGALLPTFSFSSMPPSEHPPTNSSAVSTHAPLLAFGSGIPATRGGGGTR